MREDGVELAWSLLTPALDVMEAGVRAPIASYRSGSATGPDEAVRLMEKDGRSWRPL
jgi:glucose-6-phosphate 1-dehydrogenase